VAFLSYCISFNRAIDIVSTFQCSKSQLRLHIPSTYLLARFWVSENILFHLRNESIYCYTMVRVRNTLLEFVLLKSPPSWKGSTKPLGGRGHLKILWGKGYSQRIPFPQRDMSLHLFGEAGCQFNSILIFGPFLGCVFGCIFGPFLLFTLFSWDICPFSKFHFGAIFGAVFRPFLMLLNCAPVISNTFGGRNILLLHEKRISLPPRVLLTHSKKADFYATSS